MCYMICFRWPFYSSNNFRISRPPPGRPRGLASFSRQPWMDIWTFGTWWRGILPQVWGSKSVTIQSDAWGSNQRANWWRVVPPMERQPFWDYLNRSMRYVKYSMIQEVLSICARKFVPIWASRGVPIYAEFRNFLPLYTEIYLSGFKIFHFSHSEKSWN